jgi:hypothetical protein
MDADNAHLQPGDDGLLCGMVILKSLVLPWARTDRIVCADSYFALVGALQGFKWNGLHLIGVVKTATWQYPQQSFLSNLETTFESACLRFVSWRHFMAEYRIDQYVKP